MIKGKYADLISLRVPSEKRRPYCDDEHEHFFSEGGVMLAFAFHLFEKVKGVQHVDVFPDGMHDTELFRFRPILEARGFKKLSADTGRTVYSGQNRKGKRTLSIDVRSGQGDVVAIGEEGTIISECKGGCINTRHPGQKSHQQQRLYAAVGHLIERPRKNERHIAVVPETTVTLLLAAKLAPRARQIGIDIALVKGEGVMFFT